MKIKCSKLCTVSYVMFLHVTWRNFIKVTFVVSCIQRAKANEIEFSYLYNSNFLMSQKQYSILGSNSCACCAQKNFLFIRVFVSQQRKESGLFFTLLIHLRKRKTFREERHGNVRENVRLHILIWKEKRFLTSIDFYVLLFIHFSNGLYVVKMCELWHLVSWQYKLQILL